MTSCNKKYDVTGVWTCITMEQGGRNSTIIKKETLTLTSDGEITEETINQGFLDFSMSCTGIYRVSNDTILITYTKSYINGKRVPMDIIPDNIKKKILKVDKDSLVYMQDNKITRMKRK